MFDSGVIQIMLFAQIFILGVLSAVAYIYIRKHLGHNGSQPIEAPQQQTDSLPPALKQRLLDESEVKFQSVINHLTSQLNSDLENSVGQINHLVNKLATDVVSGEMERYRKELSRLHDQANTEMATISSQIAKHEEEIKAKVSQEFEAEKQRLIKQLDTKLADGVSAFLMETLQHNVDLGSQGAYLTSMLEEHKAELIKEVGGDAVES